MQVLRNDISNVLSGELWICMKVSKAMFKKENIFRGNYVQERKELQGNYVQESIDIVRKIKMFQMIS